MTIDNNLLKQALELQKSIGKEPWMDDIQTIRAMRVRRVSWQIIYTVISDKHNLLIPQEVFERQAQKLLKPLSSPSKKKKLSAPKLFTVIAPEGGKEEEIASIPEKEDQDPFEDLERNSPIS